MKFTTIAALIGAVTADRPLESPYHDEIEKLRHEHDDIRRAMKVDRARTGMFISKDNYWKHVASADESEIGKEEAYILYENSKEHLNKENLEPLRHNVERFKHPAKVEAHHEFKKLAKEQKGWAWEEFKPFYEAYHNSKYGPNGKDAAKKALEKCAPRNCDPNSD